jgi:hypothetical protein
MSNCNCTVCRKSLSARFRIARARLLLDCLSEAQELNDKTLSVTLRVIRAELVQASNALTHDHAI